MTGGRHVEATGLLVETIDMRGERTVTPIAVELRFSYLTSACRTATALGLVRGHMLFVPRAGFHPTQGACELSHPSATTRCCCLGARPAWMVPKIPQHATQRRPHSCVSRRGAGWPDGGGCDLAGRRSIIQCRRWRVWNHITQHSPAQPRRPAAGSGPYQPAVGPSPRTDMGAWGLKITETRPPFSPAPTGLDVRVTSRG